MPKLTTARVACVLAAFAVALPRAADVDMFDGRPAFEEGQERSYYVWRDGRKWHVRWTTMGALRHFTGTVSATGGDLDDLKRIDVETERRVIAAGRPSRVVRGPRGRVRVAPGRGPVVASRDQDHVTREGDRLIRFSARTDADIDGFDFEIDDEVRELQFTLRIEGETRAADVEVGRHNRHPAANPFVVRLR
jgi:hypothetical protein